MRYVPPYLKEIIETPEKSKCTTEGKWPSWLGGTFLQKQPRFIAFASHQIKVLIQRATESVSVNKSNKKH